ncbi:relaxase MobL [Streptomyces sp. NRRL F-5053]|uniref:relaxase MobL n=1 Tax=Streptomyces sp. NRRL F-5053 TaxID=1463854 RepID=UPI000AA6F27F|nr:relaxase MobL [Streptomyces sp. NRRL F-5053]
MGLEQDIVCVNEFSVPLPGGKGSRGSTPGDYVTRYMVRDGATETLAPIQRLRTDSFLQRYTARESAVGHAGVTSSAVKREMKQAQRDGGVAFGYGSVSLSDEQLRAASQDIQHGFDRGKTVLKTVLSFDEGYLQRRGIVSEDFHCQNRGDYRGHIDQMKLRMAIMHGLDRMSSGTSGFDDFRYVATIQVDTEHVHCHIAGYDAGKGALAADGTQRGKLLGRHRSRLRRGIDAWLDEKQKVARLTSAVGYERRNVTLFIKRWAYERVKNESLPQFLLACLPADRSLWQAGSNDPRIRKASQLVAALVGEQLERAGSPMPEAMEQVVAYATRRREAEGLSADEWQHLVDGGRAQITERAVNGVYQVLRTMPADELTVHTPMLEVMGMDHTHMATLSADRQRAGRKDDLVSFGFRLRSCASRLAHHTDQTVAYRDLTRQWERAKKTEAAADASRPLYDFYRFEEDYHQRVMSKYQYFLPFLADPGLWHERKRQTADHGRRLLALMALRQDISLQRMTSAAQAEQLGRDIYGSSGGRYMAEGDSGLAVLDARITAMQQAYAQQIDELRADLASSGLVLTLGGSDTQEPVAASDSRAVTSDLKITPGAAHAFHEVKALDLHHLGYDFATDVAVDAAAAQAFISVAADRRRHLLAAMEYLDGTGQPEAIRDLPVNDVAAMIRTSRELTASADNDEPTPFLLRSKIAELQAGKNDAQTQRSKAPSLDAGLLMRVQRQIDTAVAGTAGTDDLDPGWNDLPDDTKRR